MSVPSQILASKCTPPHVFSSCRFVRRRGRIRSRSDHSIVGDSLGCRTAAWFWCQPHSSYVESFTVLRWSGFLSLQAPVGPCFPLEFHESVVRLPPSGHFFVAQVHYRQALRLAPAPSATSSVPVPKRPGARGCSLHAERLRRVVGRRERGPRLSPGAHVRPESAAAAPSRV